MSVLTVVHLVTQRNQPYGSTRCCCEYCGAMVIGPDPPKWTDDLRVWEDRKLLLDHDHIRCDDLKHQEEEVKEVLES